ncbi:MAG TPA: hypothetical protein VD930_00895 [Gemmatimonadales bacterium]|nr:hypothetical protein [Gemmatimonadales bacterium]
MSWIRRSSLLSLALLLTVGVACTSTDTLTEAPAASSSEQAAPQFGLIGDLTDGLTNTVDDLTGTVTGTLGSVTDLLTCTPQPYAVIQQSIGPNGGVLRVGTHTLKIPGNAVQGTVLITAEQIPGSTNSVRFSPEGLRFLKPVELTMTYDNCALVLLQKKIVYTDENLKILEVLRSLDLLRKKEVQAEIDHFSRYAVAY